LYNQLLQNLLGKRFFETTVELSFYPYNNASYRVHLWYVSLYMDQNYLEYLLLLHFLRQLHYVV